MRFVDVRKANLKDVNQICDDLDLGGEDRKTMRKWYLNSPQVWAGLYKNNLACLYGVYSASFLSETAYLWLTTNGLVHEHPFLFVRHSQMIVAKLLETHKMIVGHVSANSPDSIRWLEWLGVKLKRDDTVNGMIPFELKRAANG